MQHNVANTKFTPPKTPFEFMSNPIDQTRQVVPVQDRIINATCSYFNVSEPELLRVSIDRDVAYRKRVACFLLRENTRMSFRSISERLNYRNKQSAFKGAEQIDVHKNIYKQVANDVKEISRIALL